jgi:hypothetical protein
MYIIDDTYFQPSKREVPNLDEADSRTFAELQLLIDEKCRLLLLGFLTLEQFTELDSYLVDGIFPEDAQPDELLPNYVPQKWIDLVNGATYIKNGVTLNWTGLIYKKGAYKGSLLADYVYYYWLTQNVSYMTGVGDAKGNPKGASLVIPTQRVVNTWNDFVKQYQSNCNGFFNWNYGCFDYSWYWVGINYSNQNEVSLIQFLSDKDEDYPNDNRRLYAIQNQLGL